MMNFWRTVVQGRYRLQALELVGITPPYTTPLQGLGQLNLLTRLEIEGEQTVPVGGAGVLGWFWRQG
jgi:hypothetical protein